MKKINLAVVFGGQSGEHEVSLSSARAVMENLSRRKYNVIPIAITKGGSWLPGKSGEAYMKKYAHLAGKEGAISPEKSESLVSKRVRKGALSRLGESVFREKIDLVFPIIHGPYGEDGRLQGMLDMLGVPYVFSGVLAHAVGMNKPKAKVLAENAGVRVARGWTVKSGEGVGIEKKLRTAKFPVMVKPSELGSSVGISLAKNPGRLKKGIKEAFKHGREVLVEEYIKGREMTVTVMGDEDPRVLAVTEIIPRVSEFYDYKAKYEPGGSDHICPAEMPRNSRKKIEKNAVAVFSAIGCLDLARIDFIWEERHNEFYFIDINTVPGMTPTSLAPEAAGRAGMDFSAFLDRLIEGAMKRSGRGFEKE